MADVNSIQTENREYMYTWNMYTFVSFTLEQTLILDFNVQSRDLQWHENRTFERDNFKHFFQQEMFENESDTTQILATFTQNWWINNRERIDEIENKNDTTTDIILHMTCKWITAEHVYLNTLYFIVLFHSIHASKHSFSLLN